MINNNKFSDNLRIYSLSINIAHNNIAIDSNLINNNTELVSLDFYLKSELNSLDNDDDEVAKNCKINKWRKDYFDFLEKEMNKIDQTNQN